MKKKGKPSERCAACSGVGKRIVMVGRDPKWSTCEPCGGSGAKRA